MDETRAARIHGRSKGSRGPPADISDSPDHDVTQHAHVHAQIAPLIKPLILRVFEDRFESLWPGSLTSTEL